MDDDPEMIVKPLVLSAQEPIEISLSKEGDLMVEFSIATINQLLPALQLRAVIVFPPEQAKSLIQRLSKAETIQETLSAKRPAPGAH